jgi:hypothetical protein
MAYSIYGASFFLLTGFHGLHVTVGLFFLIEQYERITVDATFTTSCAYAAMPVTNVDTSCHVLLRACAFRYVPVTYLCQVCTGTGGAIPIERRVQLFDSDHHLGLALGIVY